MPKITYVEANGTEHVVDLSPGISLMQGAINNLIPGIEGDCGGLCACATCHIYVPPEWATRCGTPDELETSILDFAFDVQPTSRLACQIHVSDALDGLVVRMPERQY
jgi:ferredoxin, 2Fe-2S